MFEAELYQFFINDDTYMIGNYEGFENTSDESITINLINRPLINFYMWKELKQDTNITTPLKYSEIWEGYQYPEKNIIQKDIIQETNFMTNNDRLIQDFDIDTINWIQTEYNYRTGSNEFVPYQWYKDNYISIDQTLFDIGQRFIINYNSKNSIIYSKQPMISVDIELLPGEYIKNLKFVWESNVVERYKHRLFSAFTKL